MTMKGFTRKFKPLEILTEEQIEDIHRGTLDVLWETGLTCHHKRALKLFEENGCKVDYGKERVKFPPGLVEESLRKAPSSFRVKARDPKNDIIVGGNTVYFKGGCGMETVDLDTGEPRVATRQENYDGVRIMDALENLHFLCTYSPYFGFEDVSPSMAIPESCAAKFRNSIKAQREGHSMDSEIFTIKMAKAVGADLIVSSYLSPPLTYYEDEVGAAFRAIEADFPIFVASAPVMGGTAPATIAGATVTNNAEQIAGVILAQLIKPGAKVIVGDCIFPQNMRTGTPDFGQIGEALHIAAFGQIWRKYGIPTNTGAAPSFSNSKQTDFQCGYERAILMLVIALSGFNLMGLHGSVYGELSWSPLQAILDDDIAGMVGRFIEGVEVNDETLAIDLINEVGPIPGHYLNKAHTRKWWKKEQFIPKVADRLTYPEWMEKGKKSCLDYAKERMEEILATHKPTPLTEDQDKEIERILKEARKYYKERGII